MSLRKGLCALGLATALVVGGCTKDSGVSPTPVDERASISKPADETDGTRGVRAQDDASGGEPSGGQQDPPPKP
jgi:hypothetical protein